MTKILGLDLGSNSIGWSLIDSNNKKIINCGVRIFPEGVENLGEGENEISRNASRRAARQARKSFFRRKLRKKMLVAFLAEQGMCPFTKDELKRWKTNGIFPDSSTVREWFKLNPYLLRQRAVKEKISLNELGRLFYHLAQRRGYQSNSRNVSDKEEGTIYEGKDGKTGITETQRQIQGETLGAYLASVYPPQNKSYIYGLPRIRNRYTTRNMYVDEFEAIWSEQSKHYNQFTEELKTKLGGRKKDGYPNDGILFYYRPLRSQKHLIGNCSFEPQKPRCPISAIPFEKFRAWQFINNIDCNGKPLPHNEKETILELLLTKSSKEKIEFKEIRKRIGRTGEEFRFNYKDDDKITCAYTIGQLSSKKYFGKKWFTLSEKEQEDIWHVLISFEDRDKLSEYAKSKWGFDETAATAISKLQLKKGYAALSRKAIGNILFFLEKGFNYDIAVALGGIRNAFGPDWDKLGEKNIDFLLTNVPEIVRSGITGGYIEPLKKMLKEEFGFDEQKFKKLYHHSAAIHTDGVTARLPSGPSADAEIAAIRNPIVIQALFELRKLLNAIIEEHGVIDEIKIELARDLKVSRIQRNKIRREQKRLEAYNDSLIQRLREHRQPVNHETILRLKLWEECGHKCPYSGREISITQLFSGEVQIEHIFPWSKSLDDSFLNKTLCFADENRKKGERTPYQYFTQDFGEAAWEQFKSRILKIFYDTKDFPTRYKKFKRFAAEKFNDDFTQRQLNDTRYISREARTYLQKICDNVNVLSGGITANLRYHWGLNSILSLEDEKERGDHRHHAIDAVVVACSNPSHLNQISKWNRYNRSYDLKEFPAPWDGFYEEAKSRINSIIVSYKQRNKILNTKKTKTKKNKKEHINKGVAARDQLHKESVYGKRTPPRGETGYHIRKPLQNLTTRTHVEKVVDGKIRQLIEDRIIQLGGYINGKDIPKETFFTSDAEGKSVPQIFLPNKNGDKVPVYKVRVSETIGNAAQLYDKTNKYVNPRNNHHLLIYRNSSGDLAEDVVSFWTVVERMQQKEPVFKIPDEGSEIVTTIMANDMFVLGISTDEFEANKNNTGFLTDHLFKVQKIAGGGYFFEICFRKNTDSRPDKDAKGDYVYIKNFGTGKTGWQTYNPIKVKVSVTGKIIPVKINV